MHEKLVEIRSLQKVFGGLVAVNALDLNIYNGEIMGLIGPNGSGKTTVLNMIDGSLFPSKGKIIFENNDITELAHYERARKGIARIFQHNVFFNSFTVLENIAVSVLQQSGRSRSTEAYSQHSSRGYIYKEALNVLSFVSLDKNSGEFAYNLPHGKQRLLSLAIALATRPRLLLLDEPLTGMNAEEVRTMLNMIKLLRDKNKITCLVVEHNLKAVIGLCDRIAVLNFGEKLAEDKPTEIFRNQDVINAYLGSKKDVI